MHISLNEDETVDLSDNRRTFLRGFTGEKILVRDLWI